MVNQEKSITSRESQKETERIFVFFLLYINIDKKNKKKWKKKIIVFMIEVLVAAYVDEHKQRPYQRSCSEN
jgi:hypothetical protein